MPLINTSVIRSSVEQLINKKKYFSNKSSTFLSSKYNASSISSLLYDIRNNYTSISGNLFSLETYLTDFYKDVESLENKMAHNGGGYISVDTVNSIVVRSGNVIKIKEINYDKIFDDIEISNYLSTLITSQNNFDMSKYNYTQDEANRILALAETDAILTNEQITFLTDYYNNYYIIEMQKVNVDLSIYESELKALKDIEKELVGHGYHFDQLEQAIENEKSNVMVDDTNYNKLQALLASTGYSSYSEYKKVLDETQQHISNQVSIKHSIEQKMKNISYTLETRTKEYAKFNVKNVISNDDVKSYVILDAMEGINYANYKNFNNSFEDVSPYTFVSKVKENYGENIDFSGIKSSDLDLYQKLFVAKNVDPNLEKLYLYIYENKGSKEALKYLESVEEQLNMGCGQIQAEKFLSGLANMDEENKLLALTNHLQVSGKGVSDGVEGYFANLGYLMEGLFSSQENRIYSSSEFETMYLLQAFASKEDKIKNGLIQTVDGKLVSSSSIIDFTKNYDFLLKHNYQISQSIGNMLPSMALTAAGGSILGATGLSTGAITTGTKVISGVSMGTSAAGGSFHSAMIEGYDKNISMIYGLTSGTVESVSEQMLGGLPLLSDTNVFSLKTLALAMKNEGMEEFLQTYMGAAVDKLILNKTIDFKETTQEAVQSGVYGGITGGIMNLPSLTINSINMKTINDSIKAGKVTESEVLSAMHNLFPETKEMSFKEVMEEYSSPTKGVTLELSKNKGVLGSASSLIASMGLGSLGLGTNSGNSNSSSSSSSTQNNMSKKESLVSQKEEIFKTHPGLEELISRGEQGLAIEIPSDLIDSYLEVKSLNYKIANFSEIESSDSIKSLVETNVDIKETNSFVHKIQNLPIFEKLKNISFQDTISNFSQLIKNKVISNESILATKEKISHLFNRINGKSMESINLDDAYSIPKKYQKATIPLLQEQITSCCEYLNGKYSNHVGTALQEIYETIPQDYSIAIHRTMDTPDMVLSRGIALRSNEVDSHFSFEKDFAQFFVDVDQANEWKGSTHAYVFMYPKEFNANDSIQDFGDHFIKNKEGKWISNPKYLLADVEVTSNGIKAINKYANGILEQSIINKNLNSENISSQTNLNKSDFLTVQKDLDSTDVQIPIPLLDNILKNESVFQKFKDFDYNQVYFGNLTKQDYILGIKQYVDILIKENFFTPDLNSRYEEIINMSDSKSKPLNELISKDYLEIKESLDGTVDIVPLDILEKLLRDENYYNNYISKDNHLSTFEGYEKNVLVLALNNLKKVLEQKNINLSETELQRYETIENSFIFDISNIMGSESTNIYQDIEVSNYLLQSILENENLFNSYYNNPEYNLEYRDNIIIAMEYVREAIISNNININDKIMLKLDYFHSQFYEKINYMDSYFQMFKKYGADQSSIHEVLFNVQDKNLYQSLIDKVESFYKGMNAKNAHKFLSGINATGVCGYATILNEIFSIFKDYESLFKVAFGYDMIDQNGKFNDTNLLLDLYLFVNRSNPNLVQKEKFKWNIGNDSLAIYPIKANMRETNILNDFLSKHNVVLSMDTQFLFNNTNMPLTPVANDTIISLKNEVVNNLKNGNRISLGMFPYVNKPDVIYYSLDGNENVSTSSWRENFYSSDVYAGGHSVMVTGISPTGDLIVSSWGKKYLLKWSELANNAAFEISTTHYGINRSSKNESNYIDNGIKVNAVDHSPKPKKIIDFQQMELLLEKGKIDSNQMGDISSTFLENDLMFFLETYGFRLYPLLTEELLKNNDFLTSLSNRNLMSLFNTSNEQTFKPLYQEITNRVNSGSAIVDDLQFDFTSLVKNDYDSALNQLPQEIKNKIVSNIRENTKLLPVELKEYAKKLPSNYEIAFFAKSYKEGKIDLKGIELLNEITNNKEYPIQGLNYSLLNTDYIDSFGSEYIKRIITDSVISSKIEFLHDHQKAKFDLFSKFVEDSYQDDSLYTFYPKTKLLLDALFNDIKQDYSYSDLNDLTEYILLTESLKKQIEFESYTENWKDIFYRQCDDLFKNSSIIYDKKNIFFLKYFSSTIQNVEKLISKYGEDIKSIKNINPDAVSLFEALNFIDKIEDPELLNDLYFSQDFTLNVEELLTLDDDLRRAYAQTYIDSINETSSKIEDLLKQDSDTITIDGVTANVIDLKGDFSLLVKSTETGYLSNFSSEKHSYKQKWDRSKSHIISTSYISQDHLGTSNIGENGVLYGFDKISKNSIAMVSPYDIHSQTHNYGYESIQKQTFVTANNMADYTYRLYNEVAIEKGSIKPNYIVVFSDMSDTILKNSVEAAAEWNIPILRIDKVEILNSQRQNFLNNLNKFGDTNDLVFLSKALNIYESTNNDLIIDSNKFKEVIEGYIKALDKKERVSGKQKVTQLLNDIQYRYELTKNAPLNVPKTKSKLNIEELIKMVERDFNE